MSGQPRVHLARQARPVYDALDAFAKTVKAEMADAGVEPRLAEIVQVRASQINGCAYCLRVHVERAGQAGLRADEIGQLSAWRESDVFTPRERAALELTEAFTLIHQAGIPDELYDRVGGILSEREYIAVSWLAISINAFNRLTIAGRYPVPPLP